MPRRFYLTPIVGTGTEDPETGVIDAYRPKLPESEPDVQWSASIPSKADGSPRFDFALVAVSADADVHAQIAQDPDVISLPSDLEADNAQLKQADKVRMSKVAQRAGVARAGNDRVRDVIRKIGRRLDGAHFHEDALG